MWLCICMCMPERITNIVLYSSNEYLSWLSIWHWDEGYWNFNKLNAWVWHHPTCECRNYFTVLVLLQAGYGSSVYHLFFHDISISLLSTFVFVDQNQAAISLSKLIGYFNLQLVCYRSFRIYFHQCWFIFPASFIWSIWTSM